MTMMPQTQISNRLLSKAPLSDTASNSMILWIKASTTASTQLAIDFIDGLPGVASVELAKPEPMPVMHKAMLRIKYCPHQTCSAQIKHAAAGQGLVTKKVMPIRFKCS